MKVLLMDAYCASHVGNDVLLESSMAVARRAWPDADIVVHAKAPDSFRESLGIVSGQRLFKNAPDHALGKMFWLLGEVAFMVLQIANRRTLRLAPHRLAWGYRRRSLRDYETADVAVSIGGEMINDSFRKTLPMYMFMFWLAGECGARVVIFPQSIGPLSRRWTRGLASFVLRRCDAVTARDRPSQRELVSLGLTGARALLSPDVGVGQPMAASGEARAFLAEVGCDLDPSRSWVGLTTSPWVEEGVSSRNYLELVVAAIKRLAGVRPMGVVIIPANMPLNGTPPSDYESSVWVKNALGGTFPVVLVPPQVVPARLFKAVAAELDTFVSTRMHASILSTMAGTPTVTINTQRKLAGYMDLIGQSAHSLDIDALDESKLEDTLIQVLENAVATRTALLEQRRARVVDLEDYAQELSRLVGKPSEASAA